MQNIRVAAVQCASDLTATAHDNVKMIDQYLSEAVSRGADLVVFPEAVVSGYVLSDAEIRRSALSLNGPTITAVVELTKKHATACVAGTFEEHDGEYYNTALLAADGRLCGVHRKVHAPPRELGLFSLGDSFGVYSLPACKIGMSVCYDNEIPESHLCLAVQGAELICMPTAWADHWERQDFILRCGSDEEVVAERERWMHMMFGARCRDTGTFSVLANYAGTKGSGPWRYVGKSMIFSPTGHVVAEAGPWNEQIIYADLDARLLHAYRAMDACALNGRRPSVYGVLLEQ